MKRVRLGKTDMYVNAIGLGCMGLTHASGLPTPKEEAVEILRKAHDMGYDFYDTAECYTGVNPDGSTAYNEEVVGIPFLGDKDARPLINGKNTFARVIIRNRKI